MVREEMIYVNSSMRDQTTYPSRSSFRVNLNHTLSNVTEFNVTKANLPFDRGVIHAGNNTFTLRIGTNTYIVELPYMLSPTFEEMAAFVQESMNNASGRTDFVCDVFNDRYLFIQNTTTTFTISFDNARTARVLGFEKGIKYTYVLGSDVKLYGPMLPYESRELFIHVREFPSILRSNEAYSDQANAVITRECDNTGLLHSNLHSIPSIGYSRASVLTIDVTDSDGQPYEFSADFSLIICVKVDHSYV